jgi:hypothetical protein
MNFKIPTASSHGLPSVLDSNLSAVTTWAAGGLATGTTCLVHDALNRLTAAGQAKVTPVAGRAADVDRALNERGVRT